MRLKANLEALFPGGWVEFCVTSRDEERIKADICCNEALNRLLLCQAALKEAVSSFERAAAAIKSVGLGKKPFEYIEESILVSKTLLGVRAASAVTLFKIPNAPNPESRSGFVRECKGLINALQISLPTPILNAMGQPLTNAEAAER